MVEMSARLGTTWAYKYREAVSTRGICCLDDDREDKYLRSNCSRRLICRYYNRTIAGCYIFVELSDTFLPRDASAERGYEIACRLSARPSVRNV